jgi:hypothetical protein
MKLQRNILWLTLSLWTEDSMFTLAAKLTANQLEWKHCDGLKCAMLEVPLNHLYNNSETIKIAINKFEARVQPAESTIIINYRRTGKNYVKHFGSFLSSIFDDKVDIIGFDPRGLADSGQINCTEAPSIGLYSDPLKLAGNICLPANLKNDYYVAYDSNVKEFASLCAVNGGDILAFTSTANIARDLDLLRKSLGMESLNFWGVDFGSLLGLTYANMFPNNVGKIILDGIINPVHYSGDIFEYFIINLVIYIVL